MMVPFHYELLSPHTAVFVQRRRGSEARKSCRLMRLRVVAGGDVWCVKGAQRGVNGARHAHGTCFSVARSANTAAPYGYPRGASE